MSKDDAARTRGEVLEVLPGAAFRVRLGNGHVIVAHVAGAMRMHMARILPGDEVAVELAPYDPTRGRIVSRTR